MNAPLTYTRQGRSPRAGMAILTIWLGLVLVWLGLQAAWWIVGFLALFTLPACWEFASNPPSGLTLDEVAIRWHSGKRHAEVALDEIDLVRLDTRLDFSVRATLVLTDGNKIRLPFEATPPHQELEDALNARNIKTQRHHFQLMQ